MARHNLQRRMIKITDEADGTIIYKEELIKITDDADGVT